MKMTRLEWRYLQGIALDHPYYDTHKPPLSDAEARAIVQANNTMTGREFVDSVYAKLGMVRPVKEKERLAWLRSIGGLFSVPSIRRIVRPPMSAVTPLQPPSRQSSEKRDPRRTRRNPSSNRVGK